MELISVIVEVIVYIPLVIAALIPIANPFSTAPIFISLTSECTRKQRSRIAMLSCIYMAVLLLLFLLTGALILQFFGISLQSLRVAGGLIIAYTGFRMLFPVQETLELNSESQSNVMSLAFTPLALPMLSGPGSISVVISMATEVLKSESATDQFAGYLVVGIGIVLSAFICWLVLIGASSIVRFLGSNGINALTRLMGFMLVCIGCEFVLSSFGLNHL